MQDYNRLLSIINSFNSVLVAYSGGVDSSLLLRAVKDTGIRACAVTVISELIPEEERLSALKGATEIGVDHNIEEINLLAEATIQRNSKERCFYCKDIIMSRLCDLAKDRGLDQVIEGSNWDDQKVWRPGMRALEKHKVKSPLLEAGLSKKRIRLISKNLGLSTWNKPSSPCLATRFHYGTEITKEGLARVDSAEAYLRSKGFYNVRVRTEGFSATVEVDTSQVPVLLSEEVKHEIIGNLIKRGFITVSIDPEGYSSGKLDRP